MDPSEQQKRRIKLEKNICTHKVQVDGTIF